MYSQQSVGLSISGPFPEATGSIRRMKPSHPRVAHACDQCRRKKTKVSTKVSVWEASADIRVQCSGEQPVCESCKNKGRVCQWTPIKSTSDRRRKPYDAGLQYQRVNENRAKELPHIVVHKQMYPSALETVPSTTWSIEGIDSPLPPAVALTKSHPVSPTSQVLMSWSAPVEDDRQDMINPQWVPSFPASRPSMRSDVSSLASTTDRQSRKPYDAGIAQRVPELPQITAPKPTYPLSTSNPSPTGSIAGTTPPLPWVGVPNSQWPTVQEPMGLSALEQSGSRDFPQWIPSSPRSSCPSLMSDVPSPGSMSEAEYFDWQAFLNQPVSSPPSPVPSLMSDGSSSESVLPRTPVTPTSTISSLSPTEEAPKRADSFDVFMNELCRQGTVTPLGWPSAPNDSLSGYDLNGFEKYFAW
jgi:hypothetical protein